uniref:3-phosphoserine/phosphohydroxythreonine transaminase n=1 Tax=Synechococcus sp. UW106 TaxID=368495 RepID=UPI000E0E0BA4|nr:3-phosphoserine/phosphohydroxythreonine transaminase [Synechococcus sp. UW106]
MFKKYNFSAGPGKLPESVLKRMKLELTDYHGLGLSIMEISHRDQVVLDLIDQTSEKIKQILELDDDKRVIFLQGGGTMQFHMVPLNLSIENDCVDYVDTGYWAEKAIKVAKELGRNTYISGKSHTSIPKNLKIRRNAKYLHLCSNNTVMGTQWKSFPETNCPIVADMSSDLLSKRINANDFGLIYAHAQKILGAAGVTIVIVSDKLLEHSSQLVPDFFRYNTHILAKSNYHTPPIFAIYSIDCMLDWLQDEAGGIEAIEANNSIKASKLYNFLDDSKIFNSPVEEQSRSKMNVIFHATNDDAGKNFMCYAEKNGFLGLKGHRSRGGFRASLYNAVTISDVNALIDSMHEFESNCG